MSYHFYFLRFLLAEIVPATIRIMIRAAATTTTTRYGVRLFGSSVLTEEAVRVLERSESDVLLESES